MVGPTDDGCFLELRVCSIQRNRSACRVLRAGQAATLALGDFDRALLRKVRWVSGLERECKEECLGDWLQSTYLRCFRAVQGNMVSYPRNIGLVTWTVGYENGLE